MTSLDQDGNMYKASKRMYVCRSIKASLVGLDRLEINMFKKDKIAYICKKPNKITSRIDCCGHTGIAHTDCLDGSCNRLVFFNCVKCHHGLLCLTEADRICDKPGVDDWIRKNPGESNV